MLNKSDLFANVNQLPSTGLKAKKEQAEDPLEGLRRKGEVEEEPQGIFNIKGGTNNG